MGQFCSGAYSAKLSRHSDLAKAMNYMLTRWAAFSRFLGDGRICLTNNAAERALRGIALGRKAWLFAGSDRGGERAAAMYSLIVTAKLNNVDPRAWLADVLARSAIGGAGLDVYEREPVVHPGLLALDNVVLLPHQGTSTLETRTAMGLRVGTNLDAFFAGLPLPDPVV